ncbi:MAG: STAS/SEC14 domain-containing protein [Anaerolineae bacterium]|nr:STAS/SEC14 domain-containing protein [Anaerolineae bacterium]
MSNEVTWHLEGQVIYMRLSGMVTVEDIKQASETVTAMAPAESTRVHLIVDLRDLQKFPTQLKELASVIPNIPRRGNGWLLFVSQNAFVRFLSSTLAQMASRRMKVFDDPQAALDFLQLMDADLPPLHPFGTTPGEDATHESGLPTGAS